MILKGDFPLEGDFPLDRDLIQYLPWISYSNIEICRLINPARILCMYRARLHLSQQRPQNPIGPTSTNVGFKAYRSRSTQQQPRHYCTATSEVPRSAPPRAAFRLDSPGSLLHLASRRQPHQMSPPSPLCSPRRRALPLSADPVPTGAPDR